jgi:hypothetical protein
MRVAPAGYLRFAVATAAVFGLVALGGGPASAATTTQGKQGFKLTVYPAYTTAGQPTTFEVTVANTSSQGATLRSLQLIPPTGFTVSHPGPNTPFRRKTQVHGRTLSLRRISVRPGTKMEFVVTATAPPKCGKSVLHWASHAFQGGTAVGAQLALQSALSSEGIIVVCPAAAACGDGGPACSTSLTTSVSTYGVISNAGSGTLRQTLDVGKRLTCGQYRFRDPNWYDSVVTSPTAPPTGAPPPVIMDQISYTIKNATANGVDFCLGAAFDFATASGGQAPAGTLPNGNPGFIGLLPTCSGTVSPPCISSISQQNDPSVKTGYDAVLSIQIPEQGDPWGGG